jgi:carbon storage regulator
MLVLTRKVGEAIVVGSTIRVSVVEIKHGQVRLGIEAPPNVPIHRDEIYARIVEENRQAAAPSAIPVDAFKRLGRTKD